MRTILLLIGLAQLGCSAPPNAGMRSPSNDYPPPERTTSDGEVMGADRRRPADTIEASRMPPPATPPK